MYRASTYLDAESIAIAEALGGGNVSDEIRKALKQAQATPIHDADCKTV